MKRLLLLAGFVPLVLCVGLGAVIAQTLAMTLGGAGEGAPLTSGALTRIPAPMLRLYAAAAATCPGLSWTLVAAIGTVESQNGTSSAAGVHSGHNRAGAEGPMQFEPATFARYDRPVPAGGVDPPSPYDPTDSVYAAVRMLCADGAATKDGLAGAVYDYNHSYPYVTQVLSDAQAFGLDDQAPPGEGGSVAASWALDQVGVPYRWGGESAATGFDCSGLVQAAWAAAGVPLPRVAQAQFDAGPPVGPGRALVAGDLVFFGPRPGLVTHVGLVVGHGVMVDAPHTGADVRVESFPAVVGARWGGDLYLGANHPGG
ncbi:MAG TPA: NlpC/P60 family protein [Acidimicrobiales bacterium]|nr:NlpC/P60 family protein [Acidimicrobiales bacterium]